MKAYETPEEKRARRLAKKEMKERKRKAAMGWDTETLVSKSSPIAHVGVVLQLDILNFCLCSVVEVCLCHVKADTFFYTSLPLYWSCFVNGY